MAPGKSGAARPASVTSEKSAKSDAPASGSEPADEPTSASGTDERTFSPDTPGNGQHQQLGHAIPEEDEEKQANEDDRDAQEAPSIDIGVDDVAEAAETVEQTIESSYDRATFDTADITSPSSDNALAAAGAEAQPSSHNRAGPGTKSNGTAALSPTLSTSSTRDELALQAAADARQAEEAQPEGSDEPTVLVLKAPAVPEPAADSSAPVKVIRAPITAAFLAATSKYSKSRVVAPDLTIGSAREPQVTSPTTPKSVFSEPETPTHMAEAYFRQQAAEKDTATTPLPSANTSRSVMPPEPSASAKASGSPAAPGATLQAQSSPQIGRSPAGTPAALLATPPRKTEALLASTPPNAGLSADILATPPRKPVWNPFAAAGAAAPPAVEKPVWNPFAAPVAAPVANPFAAASHDHDEKAFAVRLEEVRAEALKAALLFEETLGGDESEEDEVEDEAVHLRELSFARREQKLRARMGSEADHDLAGSDEDDEVKTGQDVRYATGNVKPPSDDEVLAEYAKQFERVLFDDGKPGSVIIAGIQRLQTHLR